MLGTTQKFGHFDFISNPPSYFVRARPFAISGVTQVRLGGSSQLTPRRRLLPSPSPVQLGSIGTGVAIGLVASEATDFLDNPYSISGSPFC